LIYSVIAAGVVTVVRASVPFPDAVDLGRIFFWTSITAILASLPVRLPGGVVAHTTTAPLIAAAFDPGLANPLLVCWIALVGTIELRDVRRELPIWGTLYNRFDYLLSAFAAFVVVDSTRGIVRPDDPFGIVAQIALAGIAFSFVNVVLGISFA